MHKKPDQNLYANNFDGSLTYFIKDDGIEKGRKGYYCPGCKAELEAVLPTANIRPYFRHVATNVKIERKCTFSNETYRHYLAKTILQDLKKIKVPALYKYPPRDQEGNPMFLEGSQFINAHSVSIEMPFFEDKNGNIRFGKKIDNKDMSLLIKPDVCFFNAKREPILFIELVATHKPDYDKLIKIKRLGINTVQVIVPKSSQEDIQKSFITTNHTKWLFNHEESITEYIQPTRVHSEGISSIDAEQRRLFTESVACRSHQINELVRKIEQCLESEQYRRIESSIRSEISRVERNTETNLEQLRRIQDTRREEARERFIFQTTKLEQEEIEFEEKRSNLEGRYLREKRKLNSNLRAELAIQEERISGTEGIRKRIIDDRAELGKIQKMREECGSKGKEFSITAEETRGEFRELEAKEREDFESTQVGIREDISKLREQEKSLPERFRKLKEQEQSSFEWDKREELDNFTRIREQTERTTELFELEERELPEQFESDKGQLSRDHNETRDRIRKKVKEEYASIIREIETGKIGAHGKLSSEIISGLEAIALLDDIAEVQQVYKRYQIALKAITEGTYKHWT